MPASYQATLPAQTAGGGDSTTLIATIEGAEDTNGQIVGLVLTPPAGYSTVTGVATNNVTFTFRQLRAGVLVQTVGAVTLAVGNNLVAETPLSVPITVPGVVIQPNDVVDVVMHQNGTGLAVAIGVQAEVQLV
jgi:hypothetical protein